MAAVFSFERRLRGLLAFESGLAQAMGDLGLASAGVVDEIVRACEEFGGDPEAIVASGWERGTPLLSLLEQLRSRLSVEAGQTLHRGTTSQDAIDTGLMLQIKEALALLAAGSTEIVDQLLASAQAHEGTPYMARTLLQEALPATFGWRATQWHDTVSRARAEIEVARSRLPVQLGGPIGDARTMGHHHGELTSRLAARLDLIAPSSAWHSDRWHVRRAVNVAVEMALAMEKIGSDLALLAGLEIVSMRAGESSSMAHKRNPIDAIRAVTAARACVAAASALTTTGGRELERGIGAWQVEWWAVPQAFQTSAAAVEAIKACLHHLEVH
jgi:3-carboxy-cis,cis-muconate cycloisomerase